MGDYTKKGQKIGTCGSAYYATKTMIEKEFLSGDNSSDVKYYLDKKQSINFAFPFPEYDGKNIGEISNFHEGERVDFYFKFMGESVHNNVCHHMHPKGGQGVNIFSPCPQSGQANTSSNFDPKKDGEVFRLVSQYNDKNTGLLSIGAECIYCNTVNIFSLEEADKVCCNLLEEAEYLEKDSKNSYYNKEQREQYKKKADYINIIVSRIINTYKDH